MEENDATTPAETDDVPENHAEEPITATEEPAAAEAAVAEEPPPITEEPVPQEPVPVDELLLEAEPVETRDSGPDPEDLRLKAIIEAIVYITDEPLTSKQIAEGLGLERAKVEELLDDIVADCSLPERGLTVRELAGGYKMATKPEHHEAIRAFVKKLTPPLKLSMAALETLAVIAYKQPITSPEIMEIRGVQGAGVLKTLLDRKLITAAGRKAVIGKPVLYKTTKEFLVQFGLKDLSELPTLKEFEELARIAIVDSESAAAAPAQEEEPMIESAAEEEQLELEEQDQEDGEAPKGPQSETVVADPEQKSAAEG